MRYELVLREGYKKILTIRENDLNKVINLFNLKCGDEENDRKRTN